MFIQSYVEGIKEYKNPFKDKKVYPFCEIGRVIVDRHTGEIKCRLHEDDSEFDINLNKRPLAQNEDVMVYFPAFYYKRDWVSPSKIPTDSILTNIPTDTCNKGVWTVHPAFIKPDNTLRPYVLVGAFQGIEINGELRSIPSGVPITKINLVEARKLARKNNDSRWNILTMDIISMIQTLYKVAFPNIDSTISIGHGWGEHRVASNGNTMNIGNKSGTLTRHDIYRYDFLHHMHLSVFGIENLVGNIDELVDGFIIKDDGYYTTHNPSNFGNVSFYNKINGCSLPSNIYHKYSYYGIYDGLFNRIEQPKGVEKIYNIPCNLGGARHSAYGEPDSDSYYGDEWCIHILGEENICLFGGNRLDGNVGMFHMKFNKTNNTKSQYIGARLVFLP